MWYPVVGGCPHCKKPQNIPTPEAWMRGLESVALTKCSECNGGFYVRIAKEVPGIGLLPVDLKNLKNKARPQAYQVEAQLEEGIVLMPSEIMPKTQA